MKSQVVRHVATLANIPITDQEEVQLAKEFDETLLVIDKLSEIDTSSVQPTHSMSGLTNVFREDIVDEGNMLSQKDALKNAKATHNGYFVVGQLIDQGD